MNKLIKCYSLLTIAFFVLSVFSSCNNQNNVNTSKGNNSLPNTIQTEARLEAIEVAMIGEKNGRGKLEAFNTLMGFESDKYGPYELEEAKTAYIALKMKVAKPTTGDFSIEVTNKTTYIEPVIFVRSVEHGDVYFGPGYITLSKGRNILEVKVKNPDNSKEKIYTIFVQYGGGIDPLKLDFDDRKIIPGIYCPAQRKPLEGELPDLVWMIVMAGW
ncbi:MAG: hypothetical protein ACTTJ6_00630 [Treponema sp.]